ncbi:MAG: FAD-binding oxidoreductase [Candidatus Micrarchaeota archaeon]|nr:FAD-binding oxidoreductase [Candidatus Micrarchaeota archaeon]
MDFKEYFVTEIRDESEDVRTFRLKRHDGVIPAYQPGHFFLLQLPDSTGKPTHRPYSVASAPWEDGLQFCVKLKGTFPTYLWKLKVGSRIMVSGPYGIFLLNPNDTERVFVGGGVGISALRSMILQTIREGKKSCLFHSAHTKEGLIYYSEIKALSEKNPHFKFYPSITGENRPEGWDGLSGRINVEMIKAKLESLVGKTFYLCGSKEMAGSLAISLASAGVPKERIKKDEWG